ncbi:tetraspanin-5-like [Haliotis cracherodii]|uniref:tetraspanin-5-like n=1 Tax=Haliotis rufescens TaxID=6454 RepID=UPI001EB03C88|nr:tetraspanin-5-like [Haliotis rufescens]
MPRKTSGRSRRRDKTEVSRCIKYLMFTFNVVFWLIGGAVCGIGIWAWAEKDMFQNIGKLTNLTVEPALIFIIVGLIMTSISFCGCIGALRENTCLLCTFMVCLGFIFVCEITVGILAFVYKPWVREQIETQVKNMIVNYREDVDLQNLVDWVQHDWLFCCGVHTFQDWGNNMYFNCSSPGVEACGVPFSCCKPTDDIIQNRHCGYGMRSTSHDIDRSTKIYTTGCLPSGEKWLEANLIPVAAVAVSVALLQIFAICFAQNLRNDIQAQRAKWG